VQEVLQADWQDAVQALQSAPAAGRVGNGGITTIPGLDSAFLVTGLTSQRKHTRPNYIPRTPHRQA